MIGKVVRYKHRDILDKLEIKQDTTEYIVVDFSPKTNDHDAEIAIIQDFPYADGTKKQSKIWQALSLFDILY